MIMNKLKKALVMVLALAMVLTCAMVTPVQAAGKLNKKSVSIYETETVSLTVKGVKPGKLPIRRLPLLIKRDW